MNREIVEHYGSVENLEKMCGMKIAGGELKDYAFNKEYQELVRSYAPTEYLPENFNPSEYVFIPSFVTKLDAMICNAVPSPMDTVIITDAVRYMDPGAFFPFLYIKKFLIIDKDTDKILFWGHFNDVSATSKSVIYMNEEFVEFCKNYNNNPDAFLAPLYENPLIMPSVAEQEDAIKKQTIDEKADKEKSDLEIAEMLLNKEGFFDNPPDYHHADTGYVNKVSFRTVNPITGKKSITVENDVWCYGLSLDGRTQYFTYREMCNYIKKNKGKLKKPNESIPKLDLNGVDKYNRSFRAFSNRLKKESELINVVELMPKNADGTFILKETYLLGSNGVVSGDGKTEILYALAKSPNKVVIESKEVKFSATLLQELENCYIVKKVRSESV